MTKAILTYTPKDIDNARTITLESGSLYYVDYCTKNYKNIEELKSAFNYQMKIGQSKIGELVLWCICDNETREKLPLLINDPRPLIIRDDYYNNKVSELERARKLLLSSKNRMFITGFLKSRKFTNALNFNIKLSIVESKYLLKTGIEISSNDDGYFIGVKKLFDYAACHTKLGPIRDVFEIALDKWKEKISNLPEEDLYYYSRNLRILLNEYYSQLKTNKGIKNLHTYKSLINVILHNKKIAEPVRVKTKKIVNTI